MEHLRYLLEPRTWEELPPRWGEIFGRDAPLVVEIGFGNGEFLAEMAVEHPEWNFVGFELSLTCIERAGRKLLGAGVDNVRLIRLDGRFGLRELFPDGSVRRVISNFPCPWPKARHADRRLVSRDFARSLAAVLEPKGTLELLSDHLPFLREAAERLESIGAFRIRGPEEVVGPPRTRYERKWRERGLRIYGLVAEKVKSLPVGRIAEGKMPHVRLDFEVGVDALRALPGLKEVWEGGAFVVKEVYLGPSGDGALLRTYATDGDFTQHYFIAVSKDPKGWIVKLDGATMPFRTPAVKRSITAVAHALRAGP